MEPRDGRPQVAIVAQPPGADTVLARPPQALVVEVRGPDGQPRPRTTVRFSALPTTDPKRSTEASVGVAGVSSTSYTALVIDSTGVDGRARVLVGLGTVAGPTGVVIHVPEFGILDTFALTVRAGSAAAMQFVVRDTVVTVGARYSIGATVADRYKNSLPDEPVTYAAGSSMVTVDAAGTVTVASTGRGFVVVRARTYVDTARVSVVPTSRVVWYAGGALSVSRLDGTESKVLTRSTHASTYPHPSPDGQTVAYYEGSPNESSTLSVVTAAGVVRQVAAAATGGPAWPRWSPDGEWIYFSTSRPNFGRGVSRVRPDGTGLQQIGPSFSGSTYNAVGVSPDGKTVVVQDLNTPLLIDVATGSTRRLSSQCGMPQFSPDGQRLACIVNSTIRVVSIDGTSDRLVATRPIQTVGGVDWSSDGSWLLVSGNTAPELISVSDGAFIVLSKLAGSGLTQASFIP